MSSRLRPHRTPSARVCSSECLRVCATFSKTVRRTAFLLPRVPAFSNLSHLAVASAFSFDLFCVPPSRRFFSFKIDWD